MKITRFLTGLFAATLLILASVLPAPAQMAQGTYGYFGIGNAPSTLLVSTRTNLSGAIDCRGYATTGLALKYQLMSPSDSTSNTVTATFALSYDGVTAETNRIIHLSQVSSASAFVGVSTNVTLGAYGWIIPLSMTNNVSGTGGPTVSNLTLVAFQKPGF